VTVLLLDFFGTLVDYDPSRTAQGYHQTHSLLHELGAELAYEDFLERWSLTGSRFDATSDEDDREFSMLDLSHGFLTDIGLAAADADVARLARTYVTEWNQGVRPIGGVPGLVEALAREHRLGVVTNTHDPDLVPGHLEAMGVADHFAVVVTSVEVGWRKPHPAIYAAAMRALAVTPDQCTFVGDTRGPDYDGPRAVGMRALLIDPHDGHADVDRAHRLGSVLELSDRL